ncbi:c-type cytochrome [Psychrobacter immobilis]|uniref:c-type cytochrome n=1 Tax=Psychrobacter immobilis TaxID=498 RepID=UPI001917E5B2|nr:c-type cytochrome [Psychrobacter immobilis]
MSNKQPRMSFGKWTLSVFSISALLALSACSGDNTTAEEPAAVSESADAVAVEPAPLVAEPEVVTPEPAVESEVSEAIEEPVAEAEPEVLAADAGAKLYEAQCKMCHAQGLLEAPKYGDKAAWAARLTKGKDTLHMHSAKGFNKMPAQVTDKVSEAQVYAAVDYMIAAVS